MIRLSRLAVGSLVVAILSGCGGGGAASSTTAPSSNGATGGTSGGTNSGTCPANTICMIFSAPDGYSAGTGNGSFAPANLTVSTGSTVTFSNNSGVAHNVVFDGATPPGGSIGVISSGTQARTFTAAGAYPFHCAIHEGMAGTITVQ